jgi:toxin ParE1/3/4
VKPCVPSARATTDIDKATDYYLNEASPDVALQFIEAYDQALAHISRFPGTGSPKYAQEGAALTFRFWGLSRFPYAVFYIERPERIELARVLHQASDIPEHLSTD